ncbi:MAG: hypothetical protein NC253_03670 [Ruminococcus sp.]|nr:hypothetical protein [Ruminococcus sp.]MCM1479255.1 hypothetical protein [Muribaculaceae bacterium]
MRKPKISLDFTSLLDITMIILFAFLVSFKFSADETQARAEAEIEKANAAAEQLETDRKRFEEEKEEWQKQAEKELEQLRKADKNAADNAEALLNFQNGAVFKIDLEMQSRSNWEITVYNGETPIAEILSENSENLGGEIVTVLDSQGFQRDDVLIGIFLYDPEDIGSATVREDFSPKIKDVSGAYENFYCAEVRK